MGGWEVNVRGEVIPNRTSTTKERERGFKFWSFCDNVIIECPPHAKITFLINSTYLPSASQFSNL